MQRGENGKICQLVGFVMYCFITTDSNEQVMMKFGIKKLQT